MYSHMFYMSDDNKQLLVTTEGGGSIDCDVGDEDLHD